MAEPSAFASCLVTLREKEASTGSSGGSPQQTKFKLMLHKNLGEPARDIYPACTAPCDLVH